MALKFMEDSGADPEVAFAPTPELGDGAAILNLSSVARDLEVIFGGSPISNSLPLPLPAASKSSRSPGFADTATKALAPALIAAIIGAGGGAVLAAGTLQLPIFGQGADHASPQFQHPPREAAENTAQQDLSKPAVLAVVAVPRESLPLKWRRKHISAFNPIVVRHAFAPRRPLDTCQSQPDREGCTRQSVLAADDRLRRAYDQAIQAGISRRELISYRDQWLSMRAQLALTPPRLVMGYRSLEAGLNRAADNAQARGERRAPWSRPWVPDDDGASSWR